MNTAIIKNAYMNNLFRYIENNMPNVIDTELLTNIGYVSCAQLYRDFYSLTGHSVKEYIRKRRLSNALALIKTSDMGLTEIAMQCGYSSHQALCRAVKHTLSMSPSDYKCGDTYYFYPPWCGEPLQSVTVSSEIIPPTLLVLFYHSSLKDIENNAVNALLHAFPEYNGRIFGRNGEQANSKLCYELYLTDTNIDYHKLKLHGFEIMGEMPCFSAMFASSIVKYDEQKINTAWDYIYSTWLQNSMFEYTDEPYYEEYIIKNGKPVKLKLYLPIRKRSTDTMIALINNPGLKFIVSKAKGYNAEEAASQAVIDYLLVHYPYIIISSKEFYLRKELNSYVCGFRVKSEMKITDTANIESITTDDNKYLMLKSSVIGDYDLYSDILLTFAKNNGMNADKEGIFAVYNAKESYENPSINMYCPIRQNI